MKTISPKLAKILNIQQPQPPQPVQGISNIRNNCVGTISFDGKFANMRKAQDFVTYPLKEGKVIKVQSDSRYGHIDLDTGKGVLSESKEGASSVTLLLSQMKKTAVEFQLTPGETQLLRQRVKSTGGASVGDELRVEVIACDDRATILEDKFYQIPKADEH